MDTDPNSDPTQPVSPDLAASTTPWEVLADYATGAMTPEASAELENRLSTRPEFAAEAARVARGLEVLGPLESNVEVSPAYRRLQARLGLAGHQPQSEGRVAPDMSVPMFARVPRRDWFFGTRTLGMGSRLLGGEAGSLGARTLLGWFWAIGATAILTAILLFVGRGPSRRKDVTRTYVTTTGQQAMLTLDDGTRVLIAPQTTFRLIHFGDVSRTVTLDRGEAYFSVARASGIPFIVHSGAVITRVLGTDFLVRYNASDMHVRVAVGAGKVRVTNMSRLHPEIVLTPGQIGDVMDSTVRVNRVDDLVPGVERAPGQLIFHDTPVSTILRTLSQWYGYEFRYTDHALAQRPVTMAVSMQSSTEALAAIERVLAVNLTVIGDTVTLTPHPVRPVRGTPRTYDVWTSTKEVGR